MRLAFAAWMAILAASAAELFAADKPPAAAALRVFVFDAKVLAGNEKGNGRDVLLGLRP